MMTISLSFFTDTLDSIDFTIKLQFFIFFPEYISYNYLYCIQETLLPTNPALGSLRPWWGYQFI